MLNNLVSIIVPVYNVEKYLQVCIESIVNQSYKQIEVILVNDGSTDSSYNICKTYANIDNRIVLIDKKNEGLSSARQVGINRAMGEFVCTVDSDDFIEKDFVEKMLGKINEEDSDICACSVREFSSNHSKIHGFNDYIKSPFKVNEDYIQSNLKELLGTYYMSDSWNKIYRTSFIKNSKVVFSLDKKYNGTDLLFNHLLMLHLPKISILDDPLYNYQIVENSRVRRKNKQLQKGFFIIINKIKNEIEMLGYPRLLNKQIGLLHLSFQKYAAQDVFNSIESHKEKKSRLNLFLEENKRFLNENNIIINCSKKDNSVTFSDAIFNYCLNRKNSKFLYYFLSIRKSLVSIVNR